MSEALVYTLYPMISVKNKILSKVDIASVGAPKNEREIIDQAGTSFTGNPTDTESTISSNTYTKN